MKGGMVTPQDRDSSESLVPDSDFAAQTAKATRAQLMDLEAGLLTASQHALDEPSLAAHLRVAARLIHHAIEALSSQRLPEAD